MESDRFTTLIRSLASGSTRRGAVANIAMALIVAPPLAIRIDALLAKHKKHKRRKRKRKASSSPTPPTGPMIRADAACAETTGSNSSANGNARYAQTFTALPSGPLVRADIRIAKQAGTIGDYILRLSAVDASHAPTNTVLASALLPDGTVANGIAIAKAAPPGDAPGSSMPARTV
jgi:hypothetical protein